MRRFLLNIYVPLWIIIGTLSLGMNFWGLLHGPDSATEEQLDNFFTILDAATLGCFMMLFATKRIPLKIAFITSIPILLLVAYITITGRAEVPAWNILIDGIGFILLFYYIYAVRKLTGLPWGKFPEGYFQGEQVPKRRLLLGIFYVLGSVCLFVLSLRYFDK